MVPTKLEMDPEPAPMLAVNLSPPVTLATFVAPICGAVTLPSVVLAKAMGATKTALVISCWTAVAV